MSSVQIKSLSYQGNQLTYHLKYRDQNNIILRVREGKILVSAPIHTPDWEIEQVIYKNILKLVKVQNNYERMVVWDLYSSQPWIKIFDNKFKIKLISDNIHTKLIDNTIIMKNYFDEKLQLQKIYSFLSKQYKNWFIQRTQYWNTFMGFEFKNISVKVMKSKWGVCYPETQKIGYNTKLLHFSVDIIDYVIVHELTHLKHANHSKDFWRSVEKYLPNYRELQIKLNSIGI